MSISPASRPQKPRQEILDMTTKAGLVVRDLAVVGVRGYYRDTMGDAGRNDIGVYDDALFIISPHVFKGFNANTDPSSENMGRATLLPGVWKFALGTHNASKDPAVHPHYPALVQAGTFTVHRHGTDLYHKGQVHPMYGECLGAGNWRGWFGINIHHGGANSTTSAGCQTIHPDQWEEFYNTVAAEMRAKGFKTVDYLLLEGQG